MKTIFVISSIAVAGASLAASYSETSGIIPGTFDTLNNPTTGIGILADATPINLPVDSFDSSLGTLIGVSYTLTYYSYAEYDITNINALASENYAVSWRVGRGLDAERNSLQIPGNGTVNFAGSPHEEVVTVSASGVVTGALTPWDTDTQGSLSLASLGAFVGDGISDVSFIFTPRGFSGMDVSQTGGTQGTPDTYVAARVDVTYTYNTTDVPESSTYAAAFGLVGLVGFGWVRSRR